MNLIIDETFWIDVCQSNANLLASGGSDKAIRIFDKREPKIVRNFNNIHSGKEFHYILIVVHY